MNRKKLGGKFGVLPIVLFTAIVVAIVTAIIVIY